MEITVTVKVGVETNIALRKIALANGNLLKDVYRQALEEFSKNHAPKTENFQFEVALITKVVLSGNQVVGK